MSRPSSHLERYRARRRRQTKQCGESTLQAYQCTSLSFNGGRLKAFGEHRPPGCALHMIPVKRYTADGAPRPIFYPSAIRNEAEGSPAIRNEAGGMGPTNTYIETGDWASLFVCMHGKRNTRPR